LVYLIKKDSALIVRENDRNRRKGRIINDTPVVIGSIENNINIIISEAEFFNEARS